jgi:hypothetical protein
MKNNDNLKIEFLRILRSCNTVAKVLADLDKPAGYRATIKFSNKLVAPRICSLVCDFKSYLPFKFEKTDTIITAEDFNNFEIIDFDGFGIIEFRYLTPVVVDSTLYLYLQNNWYEIGRPSAEGLYNDYKNITEKFPFDLKSGLKLSDGRPVDLVISNLSRHALSLATLIYLVYDYEKMGVNLTPFVEGLFSKIRNFGDDFIEAIESMSVFDALTTKTGGKRWRR